MELINNNSSVEPLPLGPVVLLLLDGWGIAPISEANAITSAKTPTFLNLTKEYPVATLRVDKKDLNARYVDLGAGGNLRVGSGESVNTLTKLISQANLSQIKITETERLAALTNFFNGYTENKSQGEDWLTVSSEAGAEDRKTPLALSRIVKETIKAIKSEKYNFIVVSLPTIALAAAKGNFEMVKKIVTTIDKNLKNIFSEVLDKKGIMIVSAACGNAERMLNLGTEMIDTEITNNPVPIIIAGEEFKGRTIGLADPVDNDLSLLAPVGTLADLAPTILKILGISKPEDMTGKSLI
jgi:2,3-bisphosphoglycerate-independent phosphoglycerate mutase